MLAVPPMLVFGRDLDTGLDTSYLWPQQSQLGSFFVVVVTHPRDISYILVGWVPGLVELGQGRFGLEGVERHNLPCKLC